MLRHDRGLEHHDLQRRRAGRLRRPAGALVRGRAARRGRAAGAAGRARRDRRAHQRCPGAITARLFPQPRGDRAGACATARSTPATSAPSTPHGNLYFHGRMSDSVRCRGENVSAFEVEHVAAAHPGVEDCAMIGVAAEIGEQDIKLFVKPKAGMRARSGRAVRLARRAARPLPEPALPGAGRRVRAHAEPAHHEAPPAQGCQRLLRPKETSR